MAELIETQVKPRLEPVLAEEDSPVVACASPLEWVGTGGTATLLGGMEKGLTHFDRAALETVCLTPARLKTHQARLWSMTLAQRQRVPGLPPNRADVILMGIAIYCAIAEAFGFRTLRISTRGPRFGMVRR